MSDEFKKGDKFVGEIVFTEYDEDGDPNFMLYVGGQEVQGFYLSRLSTTLDDLVPMEVFNKRAREQFSDPADVERFLS